MTLLEPNGITLAQLWANSVRFVFFSFQLQLSSAVFKLSSLVAQLLIAFYARTLSAQRPEVASNRPVRYV